MSARFRHVRRPFYVLILAWLCCWEHERAAGQDALAVFPFLETAQSVETVKNEVVDDVKNEVVIETPKPAPYFGWDDDNFILRSADKNFILRFTGQIQNDYRSYLGKDDETDVDTFLIRRARLGIEANVYQYYEFRLLPDFDPNGTGVTAVQDAYLNIHYWDEFQVEMGRFKEPVSYEELIQDRYVPTLERSLIDQMVPGRDVGLMIQGKGLFGGKLQYAVGVFNGTINGNLDTNDRKDAAARVAVKPFFTEEDALPMLQYFGFGVSGTTGIEQEAVSPATLKTPSGIPWFTFNSTVRENGLRTRFTPELTWFWDSFGFMAQYYEEHEQLNPGGNSAAAMKELVDLPIQGWLVLGTWLVTGEQRTDYTQLIAPLRPFDPKNPLTNPGAIELLAGASRLQLGSQVFTAAIPLTTNTAAQQSSSGASELTIGFNWYFNKWVRMQFNYEHSWFDQPIRLGPGPNGLLKSDDALLTRLQVIFERDSPCRDDVGALRCLHPPKRPSEAVSHPEVAAMIRRMCAAVLLLSCSVVVSRAADDYKLGPDSMEQPNVPKGEVTKYSWNKSEIFPGTVRDYWIYVPKQYDPKTPAAIMVFQDGSGYVGEKGQFRVPTVFDNLIHKGQMPVTIGIFINPGNIPGDQGAKPRSNRSFEYDTLSDQYVRFLEKEILPEVAKKYNLRKDAAGRAICGISSGGICAFTAAWERPDLFGKVLSHVGSFTNIRGGDVYPGMIRKTEKKPIRVFLQDGSGDLDNLHGNWPLANQQMALALKFAKYDYKFEFGDGGHNGKQGGAILPESLSWLWRDEITKK